MNRHYKTLELDKILEMLAGQTSIDEAHRMALELEPQFDLNKVQTLLRQTDDAVMLSGKYGTPSFGGAADCAGQLRRAQAGGSLTTGELLKIARTLHVIRTVKEWKSRCTSEKTTLDGFFGGLISNKFLEDKINSAIISEDEISDNASPVLSDIRRKIRTASSKAREILDKIIHSSTYIKFLQDAIVTQRDGRYVVPVRSECRNNVPGLVHDTSASGATVFVEPMGVVQANNDIKILRSKEEEEIDRILFELSDNAGEFADTIMCILNLDDGTGKISAFLINDKDDVIKVARLYLSRWRIEEHFRGKEQEYDFENMRVRTLESMNNLNMMLTIHLGHVAILADNIDRKLLTIKIIYASKSLKEKSIVWLSQISRGIKRILSYAHTGIKEWMDIEVREKYKQLELKL